MDILNLQDLLSRWEKDCVVDESKPGKEILRIPNLHAFYSRQYVLHNLALKSKVSEFYILKKVKEEFYKGDLPEEELKARGWVPNGKRIIRSELQSYLDADKDLIEMNAKIAISEECVGLCSNIMKELHSRSYQLKTYVEWLVYERGL